MEIVDMRMLHNRQILLMGIILITASSQALAETITDSGEPLILQSIMQNMGKDMQIIADGISREDWKLVEKTASLIANHPKPPLSERARIMAFAGADMSKFKGFDGKTHKAAQVLGETAKSEDGYAIISDFATLQSTCLTCHQNFRKPFQKHFYGKH
jgi:cytochrome c556